MRITIGKKTFKTRHFKKAILVSMYAVVVLVTVVGMSSGAFTGR
ncbi:MAG: hypothetical protein RLZZ324_980 [Candidatus Parcubacteria bacterium]|jgi:hypothetical protein